MPKNPREDSVTPQMWEAFIAACKRQPMNSTLQNIQGMLDDLNTKTATTTYEFHLQQVVDNVTPPNVADEYFDGRQFTQPKKAERTGSEVQAVLDQLPRSVRTGTDDTYEVFQIRLDDINSWEHAMATTRLLGFFLNIRPEGGACYLLPDDPLSDQNWGNLKNMHAQYFPMLSDGGSSL